MLTARHGYNGPSDMPKHQPIGAIDVVTKIQGPDLDVVKLIRRFDGATELHRRLTKAGYPIKLKTIQMWAYRRRIPSDWLPVLTLLAEQEGRPLALHQYVRKQGRRPAPAAGSADFLQ